MSNRNARNAYYNALPFPYQRHQVEYSGADGAPSLAEKRAQRNFYYDNLDYPYQKKQVEYSNISGPPKGIDERRDVRNAYYNSLADPYMRYQPYVVQPNMPFPYYGQQQPEQVVLPNGDMGFVDPNSGNVIDEGAPVAQPPVIVPANLQSLSLLQQQQESGGETLAQEQQDFYSAEGPMDFVKSHAMVIGGVVLTGVVAVGVYLKFFHKKGGK